MKLLPKILIFLILAFPKTQQAQVTAENTEWIAKVENCLISKSEDGKESTWSLSERMLHYKVPAVSIAVIKNYEVVWAKAYGFADREDNIPATTKTLFQAASISKSINAIGVLNWIEANNIDIDSDFINHVNDWKMKSRKKANKKKITIANLLSHTAGLSVDGFNGYEINDKIPTIDQILIGKKPANSDAVQSLIEPNKEFKYSGGGVLITQKILSEQNEMKYEDYMSKNILNPIGMMNSTFTQESQRDTQFASGYWASGNRLKGRFHLYPEMAAAGLWSTPTEISRFVIEIQKSLVGESNKLLSPNMTKRMIKPQLPEGETGLGVFLSEVNDKKYFTHGGSNEGYKCYYYGSVEKGNGFVIMTNSENFDIIPEIMRSIFKVYEW